MTQALTIPTPATLASALDFATDAKAAMSRRILGFTYLAELTK